jgi:hypothetical protein
MLNAEHHKHLSLYPMPQASKPKANAREQHMRMQRYQ